MANVTLIGVLESVKFLPNNGGCFVFISEFKRGYKKGNGEIVNDKYISWKVIYKAGLTKYISDHFNKGMIVEVKGEVFPYAIDHEKIVDGISVIGQTLNMFSMPRSTFRQEQRMIHQSQASVSETPDLDTYNQPDF